MTTTLQTTTKHKEDCGRVFKNYDMTCPRCVELKNGAQPREGWQREYFARKASEEAALTKAIKEHDCAKSNCSIVCCTAFDW